MTLGLLGMHPSITREAYNSDACRMAWDSTIRAESHTLRTVPGARSYPCVASGTLGSIEG